MVIGKKVKGEIDYNDGEFVEIQPAGIEGIDEGILIERSPDPPRRYTLCIRRISAAIPSWDAA